jgi:hypothetical protein
VQIIITETTLIKIASYSRDVRKSETLEGLMDYYGKTNLLCISEEQALAYLAILESKANANSI